MNGLIKLAAFTSPLLFLVLLYVMHQNSLLRTELQRASVGIDNDIAVIAAEATHSKKSRDYFDKKLAKGEKLLLEMEEKEKQKQKEADDFDSNVITEGRKASKEMEDKSTK